VYNYEKLLFSDDSNTNFTNTLAQKFNMYEKFHKKAMYNVLYCFTVTFNP